MGLYYEFAVDPAVLRRWRDFVYIVEKFGWQHGRLISRYPRDWKRRVYEGLAGCSEIERKRIEERLATIDDRMIVRGGRVFNGTSSWVENAVFEHARDPFHAIVASTPAPSCPVVLPAEELDEASQPLWSCETALVSRRAADMANAIELLLIVSRRIALVDPYFDPDKPRFRNTLDAILQATFGRGRDPASVGLELHTSLKRFDIRTVVDEQRHCASLSQRIAHHVAPMLPAGTMLKTYVWRERPAGQEIHNRYIMTEYGGVMLGAGLDETEERYRTTHEDLHRMSRLQYRGRWEQYVDPGNAFDAVAPPFIVSSGA